MRTLLTTTLMITALLMPFASASYDIGVTGQCYEGDGTGGEDAAGVRGDTVPTVTVPTVTGAVNAVLALVAPPGEPQNGSGCTGPDADGSQDHVEAHAEADVGPSVSVEVCYDSEVRTDGGCYLNYN